MTNEEIATLLDETKCLACYGMSLPELLKLGLLSQISSGGSSPKVYRALLTQTGTNAPVATVLENTLGGTVVLSYIGVGIYLATLSGAFPQSKFFGFAGSNRESVLVSIVWADDDPDNGFYVYSTDIAGAGNSNNLLAYTPIEILVYP